MRMRDKMSCWQQILTKVHTDSLPPAEWAEIYKRFLQSWDNPYCIQSNINPYTPLMNQFLVRPRETLRKSIATVPKIAESHPPTDSRKRRHSTAHSVPPKAPYPNGRRDTMSQFGRPKSPSPSKHMYSIAAPFQETKALKASTKDHYPYASNDAFWKPNKSRESSLSGSKRQNTFTFPDASIFNPINQKDSCASGNEIGLSTTEPFYSSACQTPKRRNSSFPTHSPDFRLCKQRDSSGSSANLIKRRNTCAFTNSPQYTLVNNPVKRPVNYLLHKRNNGLPKSRSKTSLQLSEESSDELDDHMPLSKWLKKVNKPKSDAPIKEEAPAEDSTFDTRQVKRKRGRPSLQEKAQLQVRLEAESIEPPSKPMQKVAQKQLKGIQNHLKAPSKQNTPSKLLQKTQQLNIKASAHEKIIQQPQNASRSSGKQTENPRFQGNEPKSYNSPPLKKRSIKNISSETPPMPAHMPPTPMNLKCLPKDGTLGKNVGRKSNMFRRQPNNRPSHLYEHNYNRSSFEDKHQRRKPYVSKKCDISEDQIVDDAMDLTSPVGGGEASANELYPKDDNVANEIELLNSPMELFREVEEIDRCLENFINKTPSEIDHQLANTTEFFEKLPTLSAVDVKESDLVGSILGEKEELDYEEEDDDVLSVAASCGSLEDDNIEVKPNDKSKATATMPEPKPIQQETAGNQIKSILKPLIETLKPIVEAKGPKVENTKSFRIPKLTAEELKTQPPVMRCLYKQEELEKKKKTSAKPSQRPLADLPAAASSRKQREEATAARRAKEPMPVFAPPYRVPPEAVPMVSASIQPYIPELPVAISQPKQQDTSWMKTLFGVKCMQSVDNKCRSFNCDHSLSSLGEVQSRLIRMDEETLVNVYRQSLRCNLLFQTYFTSFVDVFELRQLRERMLNMLSDCRLHRGISAPLVAHAYGALNKCGLQDKAVACIMEHVWIPCKAHKFRDLTLMILRIVSSANWEDYYDKLIELDKDYKFTMPLENLITILQSSVDQGEKFLKAANLIMLQPTAICANETIMSFLANASKCHIQNEYSSSNSRVSGVAFSPPPLISAGQLRTSFRGQPEVPSFRDPPITPNNLNGNYSFHNSIDHTNSLIKHHKRM
ncbi:protein deadlock isoform X2 [Drosophila rhopaloa]|uniref:Protein deadlock isoform X2 n=1 Tax=Drosophila rhopaloa TaxID=1041015 RepID=A0A6P4FPE3_DRORH|nr:protein deadlock isoform X2 [Drosophila rhopaloa]